MKTIELKIPEGLNEKGVILLLAGKLYENGNVTAGEAAEMTGLSKKAFLEILGKFNISILSTSTESLDNDLSNA